MYTLFSDGRRISLPSPICFGSEISMTKNKFAHSHVKLTPSCNRNAIAYPRSLSIKSDLVVAELRFDGTTKSRLINAVGRYRLYFHTWRPRRSLLKYRGSVPVVFFVGTGHPFSETRTNHFRSLPVGFSFIWADKESGFGLFVFGDWFYEWA